jgi:polyisoprenyl-phosphate glycosyltransferase
MKKDFEKKHLIFLIPIYDDWHSLKILIHQIDKEFFNTSFIIDLLIVDDGSWDSFEDSISTINSLESINKVSIIKLRRNLGHQRAIALGLTFIEANINCDAVLVMDGDGEDTPLNARRLIEQCISENFDKLIFARRAKRSEGFGFRFSYLVYRMFYRILTGKQFRIGNFSIIPYSFLSRLAVISEGWNHYAAAVLKARIPYTEIDTERGTRIKGKSKMNLVSLIIHGLSSISVHGETVGVRLLISTIVLTVVVVTLIAVVISIRLLTNLAIPGWTTYVIGLLLTILFQAVSLSLFFSFIILGGRDTATFLPQRDYQYFIAENYQVYPLKEQ